MKCVTFMVGMLAAGQALAQAGVVPPNTTSYGPGRIDASLAYQYTGQTITACGRAFQNDPRVPTLVMGVSPYELMVVLNDNRDAANLTNQIICATGLVQQPMEFMLGVRAAMYFPNEIEIAQAPRPVQQCGPCIRPNGTISGRACYGGPPARPPFPPCP